MRCFLRLELLTLSEIKISNAIKIIIFFQEKKDVTQGTEKENVIACIKKLIRLEKLGKGSLRITIAEQTPYFIFEIFNIQFIYMHTHTHTYEFTI